MSNYASVFIRKANGEVGTKEDPPGSNHVKYSEWYGLIGPWCAMFMSWCADQTDCDDIIPRFAYCPDGMNWFKQNGRFVTTNPNVGDLAFYDFGLGRASHTGVVYSALGPQHHLAIEGNTDVAGGRTGGQVMRKERQGSYILGYGRPNWKKVPSKPTLSRYLHLGSTGLAVTNLQKKLNLLKVSNVPVSGRYDAATVAGVKKFQKAKKLAQDGQVGPLTAAALGWKWIGH